MFVNKLLNPTELFNFKVFRGMSDSESNLMKRNLIPINYRQFTCSQNRQSIKFQNHENINFVEKLYFFIVYSQVYIAKQVVKSLHSGFIFRENTSHYNVGG